MKYHIALFSILFLFVSCSDSGGQLVDKEPGTSPTKAIASTGTEQLPAGHPPIAQNPMQGNLTASLQPPGTSTLERDGNTVTVASLSFEIEPTWESEKPSSNFRAAQFRLPPPEGAAEPAELALFQGIGGSAEQNIQRWIGQFQQPEGSEPVIEKQEVDGLKVQILDISGTYSTGMIMGGGTPQEGQRMLAAVVEGPGGPWHFKLTGPKQTVSHWKSAFESLIASLKPAQ